MNATSRLVQLAGRIVGAVPRFDRVGQRMAVTLYRLLSEGEPVPISRLAAALGVTEDAVRATLDRYPVFYDDEGAIIGFGGLTVVEMPPHRLNVGGRTLYTWCAWDSLFIPAILGTVAQVESVCPVTRAPVSMVVGSDWRSGHHAGHRRGLFSNPGSVLRSQRHRQLLSLCALLPDGGSWRGAPVARLSRRDASWLQDSS